MVTMTRIVGIGLRTGGVGGEHVDSVRTLTTRDSKLTQTDRLSRITVGGADGNATLVTGDIGNGTGHNRRDGGNLGITVTKRRTVGLSMRMQPVWIKH